jgi:hypothetical protein
LPFLLVELGWRGGVTTEEFVVAEDLSGWEGAGATDAVLACGSECGCWSGNTNTAAKVPDDRCGDIIFWAMFVDDDVTNIFVVGEIVSSAGAL